MAPERRQVKAPRSAFERTAERERAGAVRAGRLGDPESEWAYGARRETPYRGNSAFTDRREA